ncbi:hypothetical protein N7541_007973 [Penicillium brevicompactum]|uniref:Uncharacterized protein n=1 Tax=Penicillium brevicompactum TaxID=5074 RepID=A0A9W9UPS3_PENBR|nr:uncharacterized protein N7506_003329 [Penicillium brevicompactum]KAJ5343505.1 hypothetical protein N7506_003329 [Penicillium brevicompactum]KAJ5350246.1 hypothetical protein N7541_007973 [Penicillium brevicompactum]
MIGQQTLSQNVARAAIGAKPSIATIHGLSATIGWLHCRPIVYEWQEPSMAPVGRGAEDPWENPLFSLPTFFSQSSYIIGVVIVSIGEAI